MHLRISALGLTLAARRRLPRAELVNLILAPMDTVRYFELAFVWECAGRRSGISRYLDVGSPRAVPVTLLRAHPGWVADLVNPDLADLATTQRLVTACDLDDRVGFHALTVEESNLGVGAYGLVTCVSVLEHIPDPANALCEIWNAIEPGGSLIVSVPCARERFDEYLDFNEYGVLRSDDDGWVFGQRFYDRESLERQFFAVLGPPIRQGVFGERRAGSFMETRARKLTGANDLTREPYVVATDYRRYASVDELPGIGVIAMEFLRDPRSS